MSLEAVASFLDTLTKQHGHCTTVEQYANISSQVVPQCTGPADDFSTLWLTSLLALLIGTETGEARSASVNELVQKQSSPLPSSLTPLRAVVPDVALTAALVALFHPVSPKYPPLKGILARTAALAATGNTITPRPLLEQLIRSVNAAPATSARTLGRTSSVSSRLANASLSDALILPLVDSIASIEPHSGTAPTTRPESIIRALDLVYVRDMLSRTLQDAAAGSAVVSAMCKLLEHPLITAPRASSLLLALRDLLPLCHVTPEVADTTRRVAKSYYLWPEPHCYTALDLLHMLAVERKAPGARLRALHLRERPELLRNAWTTGKERAVHLIGDSASPAARALVDLLRLSEAPLPGAADVRRFLLLDAFVRVLPSVDGRTEPALATAPPDLLDTLYTSMNEALEQAVLMGEKDAIPFRNSRVAELQASLLTSVPSPPPGATVRYQSLPSLVFDPLFLTADVRLPRTAGEEVRVGSARLPARRAAAVLIQTIVSQYLPFTGEDGLRPAVRIGLPGGDRLLHVVAQAYAGLRLSKPKLFANLDLTFILLPLDESRVGQCLARGDGWFASLASQGPAACLRMWPRLPVDAKVPSTASTADASSLTPAALCRRFVEATARSARESVAFRFFALDVWLPSNETTTPDATLPWLSRVTLGADDDADFDPSASMRKGATAALSFTLSLNAVNPFGASRAGESPGRVSVTSAVLANHWQAGDTGPDTVTPAAPWFDLRLHEVDTKRGRGRRDPSVFHSSKLEVESEGRRPFDLTVDGQAYGSVWRVAARPLNDEGGDQLSLPLATFTQTER